MTGYTTGSNNRLTSDGTFDYTYGDEGNRITRTRISTDPADDKTTEYTWDHHNRLVKIVYKNNSDTSTQQIDYTYDLFGRRIKKSVDADGAGSGTAVDTEYVYDGEHILLAFDDSGALSNRYLHGPIIDQILADEEVTSTSTEGDVHWPLTDHLGSVRDIVDSTGTVENHIVYDAYGNILSETDDTVDHIFAFTGRERDEESDLQFNRARFYDPLVGRWASEDPIGFLAGDSNLARYVSNAPLHHVDPTGLDADKFDRFIKGFKQGYDALKPGGQGLFALLPDPSIEGRNDFPDELVGDWEVTIVVEPPRDGDKYSLGHACIVYSELDEEGKPTGQFYTAAKYAVGWGDFNDGQGATYPGAQWGIYNPGDDPEDTTGDVRRWLNAEGSGMITRSEILTNPRPLESLGYSSYDDNCATYARDCWFLHTHEYYFLPGPDLPTTLGNQIPPESEYPWPGEQPLRPNEIPFAP